MQSQGRTHDTNPHTNMCNGTCVSHVEWFRSLVNMALIIAINPLNTKNNNTRFLTCTNNHRLPHPNCVTYCHQNPLLSCTLTSPSICASVHLSICLSEDQGSGDPETASHQSVPEVLFLKCALLRVGGQGGGSGVLQGCAVGASYTSVSVS